MTADTLIQTSRLCSNVGGMDLGEINQKLQQEFISQIGDKLFNHVKSDYYSQAITYDTDKDYTLYNIYKYFQNRDNSFGYDHRTQEVYSAPIKPPQTIDLYEPFRNHPSLEELPKTHLITAQIDDGLEQNKRGDVFLGDALNRHYHVDINPIIENFDYWFTTNLPKKIHDRILPIPRGVNPYLPIKNKQQIDDIRKSYPKDKLCNCRMAITSFYRETVALWANKTDWIDDFITPKQGQPSVPGYVEYAGEFGFALDYNARKNHKDIFVSNRLTAESCLRELAEYRYSICPQGNGLDTYRLPECIVCNTVPIVQHNYANYIFSKIWPMILVHRYEAEDIQQKIKDFEKTNPNIDYDYDLLLRSNIDQLMERIKYECRRDNEKSWKVVL